MYTQENSFLDRSSEEQCGILHCGMHPHKTISIIITIWSSCSWTVAVITFSNHSDLSLRACNKELSFCVDSGSPCGQKRTIVKENKLGQTVSTDYRAASTLRLWESSIHCQHSVTNNIYIYAYVSYITYICNMPNVSEFIILTQSIIFS